MATPSEAITLTEHEGWLVATARRAGWKVSRTTATYNAHGPDFFFYRPGELLAVKVPGGEAYHWSPDDQDEAWTRLTASAKPEEVPADA